MTVIVFIIETANLNISDYIVVSLPYSTVRKEGLEPCIIYAEIQDLGLATDLLNSLTGYVDKN